ncbi:MAG: deoxynucleoside kinase [Saprospiraceae bacterium]|nr:deoxynucleoside kinase [Saprospiraceae bacterium]MBK8634355.1 deoxynucleoside kinase [Saprospiraceae bacterium]MBP7643493.1 deoxynucleoside kinase [Saprospiraceae bacterium]
MNIQHVALAGNIGAGKTSLTGMLSKQYGWDALFEDANTNPYLSDFYLDMKRWAFNLQIYFLNSRYRQVLDIRSGQNTVIQDRTIYEDAHIFAPNLYEMGLMAERDFKNYIDLFNTMSSQVKGPDLLIYLRGSIPTLVDHIQLRGRDYEGNMSLDYLKRLNQRYENWIEGYKEGKLLIINIDEIDFINKPEDFGFIINQIEAEIGGLFNII